MDNSSVKTKFEIPDPIGPDIPYKETDFYRWALEVEPGKEISIIAYLESVGFTVGHHYITDKDHVLLRRIFWHITWNREE